MRQSDSRSAALLLGVVLWGLALQIFFFGFVATALLEALPYWAGLLALVVLFFMWMGLWLGSIHLVRKHLWKV